ncbi:cytochrome b-c1 complex subunit 6, mitochondrial [Drosophila elegans]|uniref:cytochrome b-c1 complex subunit 6, mitochondrial n=1 Tax=Drosophila elegans TaxID=30023 RepID=UPI0007E886F0|nr:cytochrome b-c1 complex subunit 6, mitochondrial [Drosophila elegans]
MEFKSWFSQPFVKADDEETELVDPQEALRAKCEAKDHIQSLYKKYQECNDRVNGRTKTTETCVEELFDFVTELDHCVAHTLFSKLK